MQRTSGPSTGPLFQTNRTSPRRSSPIEQNESKLANKRESRRKHVLKVASPKVAPTVKVVRESIEPFKSHSKSCTGVPHKRAFRFGVDCHRCLFMRNRRKWLQRSSFLCQGSCYSWFRAKPPGEDAPWSVGCVACSWAGVAGKWARPSRGSYPLTWGNETESFLLNRQNSCS